MINQLRRDFSLNFIHLSLMSSITTKALLGPKGRGLFVTQEKSFIKIIFAFLLRCFHGKSSINNFKSFFVVSMSVP